MYVSVFEVLRPGPGPSSVQTAGPLAAARRFVHDVEADGALRATTRINVELYGGLACASRDSSIAQAIVAGLAGAPPQRCDGAALAAVDARVRTQGTLALDNRHAVDFDSERDIAWRVDRAIAGASHALRFVARGARGEIVAERSYYSIGDGEIVDPGALNRVREQPRVAYPYLSARALLDSGEVVGKKLSSIALANESTFRSPGDIRNALLDAGDAMRESVKRGFVADGSLPGGRARRAPAQAIALRAGGGTPAQWCAAMAQAVGEENAAGGHVVAAPTSGSAGPVAALLVHWLSAKPMSEREGTVDYLLTAGTVGALLRAMGLRQAGCQSVVGVASAMAASGCVALLGGTNAQALHAAELALAPHLGLACDPDSGRIQQPCIARNAAGAAHAFSSAQTALARPRPAVNLDAVVTAMIESGRAMSARYKEASLGAAAINVVEC